MIAAALAIAPTMSTSSFVCGLTYRAVAPAALPTHDHDHDHEHAIITLASPLASFSVALGPAPAHSTPLTLRETCYRPPQPKPKAPSEPLQLRMATTPRQRTEMPGLFTPLAARNRVGSRAAFAPEESRLTTSSETTGLMTDSAAHDARKRTRHDGDRNHYFATSHHYNSTTSCENGSLEFSTLSSFASPPPLANDRYELAGGMERPGMFAGHNGDYDDYQQLQGQRGMWSRPSSPPCGLPTELASANIVQHTPNGTKPWVLNQLLSIVGGVAGKFVQFCAVPFRGFQAGGGQAYTFSSQGDVAAVDLPQDAFTDAAGPIQHTLPGDFPEDDYGVLSIESVDSERPRMSKRLRTGEDFVLVGMDGEIDSRPATPRLSERRVPQVAKSPSQIPRPVSQAGSAQRTPKRPSLIPVSRRSTIDRRSSFREPQNAGPRPSLTPRSYSRDSYGSPVMFQTKTNSKASPLPRESQRLINKMKRDEMEDDARMRRMSSQMTNLLREAREALGSTIEIEGAFTDSGGMDDEGYSEDSVWYQR